MKLKSRRASRTGPGARTADTALDGLRVEVSDDALAATLVSDNGVLLARTSHDQLARLIGNSGVVFGVDETVLNDIAAGHLDRPRVEIARGLRPNAGTLGDWRVLLLPDPGEVDPATDFFARHTGVLVEAGQPVARRISSRDGRPGRNVLGLELSESLPTGSHAPAGVNVSADPESSDTLRSDISGLARISGGKLHVTPVQVIDHDLHPYQDDINVEESILIKGDVWAGCRITSRRDIIVLGSVEDAELEAGGDIVVRRGFMASTIGSLKARGNVVANQIMGQWVEAGGDIVILNSVYRSRLVSRGRVTALQPRGLLAGCSVTAVLGVCAAQLGERQGTPTEVHVAARWPVEAALSDLRDRREQTNTALLNARRQLCNQSGKGAPASQSDLREMANGLSSSLEEIDAEHRDLLELYRRLDEVTVEVQGAAFPGVELSFDGSKVEIREVTQARVFGKTDFPGYTGDR